MLSQHAVKGPTHHPSPLAIHAQTGNLTLQPPPGRTFRRLSSGESTPITDWTWWGGRLQHMQILGCSLARGCGSTLENKKHLAWGSSPISRYTYRRGCVRGREVIIGSAGCLSAAKNIVRRCGNRIHNFGSNWLFVIQIEFYYFTVAKHKQSM